VRDILRRHDGEKELRRAIENAQPWMPPQWGSK
jgi:hypothetical protein